MQNHIDCRKIEFLMKTFPRQIHKVVVVWECEYLKAKRDNPKLAKVAAEFANDNEHLTLRECVRGGKVEVFHSYFNTRLMTASKVFYYDINSLYPSVLLKHGMPCGVPVTIPGEDCRKNLTINNKGHFYYGERRVYGAAHVQIWVNPSKNIEASLYPFIPIRHLNKSMCVLCRKCMELGRNGLCTHTTVKDRGWKGTYTTADLEYAVQLGYKILRVYEVVAHYELSKCL